LIFFTEGQEKEKNNEVKQPVTMTNRELTAYAIEIQNIVQSSAGNSSGSEGNDSVTQRRLHLKPGYLVIHIF